MKLGFLFTDLSQHFEIYPVPFSLKAFIREYKELTYISHQLPYQIWGQY